MHDDELGKLIAKAVDDFLQSPTWESFVKSQRVSSADISANVRYLDHPARSYLLHLRNHGVPVPMQHPPWTQKKKDEVLARGCHESAKKETDFVREEFSDFIKKQFWTVLPYRLVKDVTDLRLSPLGVVPQRDRRPRLIVDLTFFMVNQDCVPIAPTEAMQFGRTLQRLLQRILLADPKYGPVFMAKIDIADGFYRVGLSPRDTPKLAVMLPTKGNEEPMVAIPFVLPMGWINSPPFFSAVTETAADVMNKELHRGTPQPPHRLEKLALMDPDVAPTVIPPDKPAPQSPASIPEVPRDDIHAPEYKRPLRHADIYVDDFLALFQGTPADRLNATRTLLHVLDRVLRPLHPSDHSTRQEPASVKKLKKGDANWTTQKTVLGWVVDTVRKTIELPPHRALRLMEILQSIRPNQKRTTAKVWHRLLGELRSMAIAIPGARGLFSTLQTAFGTAIDPSSHDGRRRLKLSPNIHVFLQDFKQFAAELPSRPTRIAELLPRAPSVIGSTDASGIGMGGIAFVATAADIQAVLWRQSFDSQIRQRLVSFENPNGDITNSDLELAATVAHHDVLTSHFDLREHTVHTFHDNTPAQFWQRKGSTTTIGPAASLLRLQGHHQRHFRYVPIHDFLAGVLNRMGDDASPKALAAASPATRVAFTNDLLISQEAVRRGVVKGTQDRADRHWKEWLRFCDDLNVDPLLRNFSDPVPFLQVFATRYRRRPGRSQDFVRSGTVSDAVRSVGQTMASLGAKDLRKDATGSLDFRLQRQFKYYTRLDPPPHRVKPIPLHLIRYLANRSRDADPATQAITDMIILAFFFLLRPGEYTGTANDDTPFRFQDVQLLVGERRLDLLTATEADLWRATSVSLTFTTQKNGVRGEVVNHGLSGHDLLCPVRSTIRRVLHLRQHPVTPNTILATYFSANRLRQVQASDVTRLLRQAAATQGPAYGYTEADISARSLRAGGAMALFNSNVDKDTIQLIGRWQSDAMLRYLHLQAQPVMQGFARRMLVGGDYRFHANQMLVPLY